MIKFLRIHKLNTKLHLISVETQCNVSTSHNYWYTNSGQRYLDTTNFHYIFHIKLPFFSRYYHEVNSCPILIIVLSTKAELYVVYSSYFEITFRNMFFKSS
jgi:hypothetical protein